MSATMILPPLNGFRATEEWLEPKCVCTKLVADDRESREQLERAVEAMLGLTPSDELNCEIIAAALSNVVLHTRCPECGGGEFLRRLYVHERGLKIVDMLYCLGCDQSSRVENLKDCEGLVPSMTARYEMMRAMRRFKKIVDRLRSDGEFHYQE